MADALELLMRWILPVLGLALLLAPLGGADPALLVIDDSGGRARLIRTILADLERGDVRAVLPITADLLRAPIGVGDAADPALRRRWTVVLGMRLAVLPEQPRHYALSALDRLAATASDLDLACWPAPAASARVRHATALALDRGDGAGALRWGSDINLPADALAMQVAAEIAGVGDWGRLDLLPRTDDLGPLGVWSGPVSTPLPVIQLGATVAALDAAGRVRWQRLLPDGARVLAGMPALVVGDAGAAVLNDEGRLLPCELPAGAPLGCAAGRCWLRHGDGAIGQSLAAGSDRLTVRLPEPALHPPLAAGGALWWLTPHWLLATGADGSELGRIRHELAETGTETAQWRLARSLDRVACVHPDGRLRAVSCLTESLDLATPAQAVALLVRAARPAEAWRRAGSDPGLRAQVLATTPAPALGLAGAPVQELAATGSTSATAALWQAYLDGQADAAPALATLAARHPDIELPAEGDPRLPVASWSRLITGAGVVSLLTNRIPAPPQHHAIAAGPARAAEESFTLVTDPRHGALRRRGGIGYRLGGGIADTALDAVALDSGQRLWRVLWPAPASLPSRHLAWRDGWLVVCEGQHRLHLVDPRDGRHAAAWRVEPRLAQPTELAVLAPDRLAVLTPPGLRLRLHLLHQDAATGVSEECVELPTAADWAIPWDGGVLVRFATGGARRYPGGVAVELPATLRSGPRPTWCGERLEVGQE